VKTRISRIAGTDALPPEVVRVPATPFTEMMVETVCFMQRLKATAVNRCADSMSTTLFAT
jgi:hypothetical protein